MSESHIGAKLLELGAEIEQLTRERDHYKRLAASLLADCTCIPREEITLETDDHDSAPAAGDVAGVGERETETAGAGPEHASERLEQYEQLRRGCCCDE